MSTITVLDSTGATQTVQAPLAPGQATSANSRPVVIASDQSAVSITTTLLPSSLGTKTMANSLAVTLASDGPLVTVAGTSSDAAVANGSGGTLAGYLRAIKDAATDTSTASPVKVGPYKLQAVAASSSAQVLGTTGAVGDYVSHLVIVPATTSPGAVSIQDGAGSAITVFAGGASSIAYLHSFGIALEAASASGGWHVTTGANVSVIAVGKFS